LVSKALSADNSIMRREGIILCTDGSLSPAVGVADSKASKKVPAIRVSTLRSFQCIQDFGAELIVWLSA
jgi:hypothetical protein